MLWKKICMIGEKGNQGYLFRANDVTKCWCPLSILHRKITSQNLVSPKEGLQRGMRLLKRRLQ